MCPYNPRVTGHMVQLYLDDERLASAVAEYLRPALDAGEAAIAIVTREHREKIAAVLGDVQPAVDEGRLVLLDAECTLQKLMCGPLPDWTDFRRVVGQAVAALKARFGAVRAYGEMVDVLWQRGEREAAMRLEEHWNRLREETAFPLLCAYRIDGLSDEAYAGALQCVCGTHTHLLPARDADALERAVLRASSEVLHEPLARMMLKLADRDPIGAEMARAHRILLWLHKNMPLTAGRILAAARSEIRPA